MFDVAKFSTPAAERPELVTFRGDGGLGDQFVSKFGTGSWSKTPVKGTWFAGIPGIQFTMRELPDGRMDFAFYSYETLSEFKECFKNGHTAGNAIYFQSDIRSTKLCLEYLVEFLKKRGLW